MGGCVRKPSLVYETILQECYDLLIEAQEGPDSNTKGQIEKEKAIFVQKRMTYTDTEASIQIRECTDQMRKQAASSFSDFQKIRDIEKLLNQVKLHARILSDHIQDTHIRLIDTVHFLRQKALLFPTNYGIQWVTMLILEVLVANLKSYTQKHISLKQIQNIAEDSNIASKQDNLTEQFNEGNHSTKEEKQHSILNNQQQQKQQQQQQKNLQFVLSATLSDQVTFFSDNFIRFEMEFIEIALFLLNEKQNPFYTHSQTMCLSILQVFSSIHKDPYTSEKIFLLVDQLESDIENLVKEITNKATLIQESDLPKVEVLSRLMTTYSSTLNKIRTQHRVFRTPKQLQFFQLILKTIIDFNNILLIKQPVSIEIVLRNVVNNSLGIISVFARRSFLLKNYDALLSNLFSFFDKVKWNRALLIEQIVQVTINVAGIEAVQFNYKVYLLEQLIEYLQLNKNNASPNIPLRLSQQNLRNLQNQDPLKEQEVNEIILENFSDVDVKIRALEVFDMLIAERDKEIPFLMHSTSRIIKCYLVNFKESNNFRNALRKSFTLYSTQLANDGSSLLSLLTILSSEICEAINQSGIQKNSLLSTPKNPQQIVFNEKGISQPQQVPNNSSIYQEPIKIVAEGLYLMLLAIECGQNISITHMITDEVIMNLIFICNIQKVSLLSFQVIMRLITFKGKLTQSQVLQSSTILNSISNNSILHVFYQSIRCCFYSQNIYESIKTSIVAFQYTIKIAEEVTRRSNPLHIRSLIAYILKLIKEVCHFYKISRDNKDENMSDNFANFNSNSNISDVKRIFRFPQTINIMISTVIDLLEIIENQLLGKNNKSDAQTVSNLICNQDLSELKKQKTILFALHEKIGFESENQSKLNTELHDKTIKIIEEISQQKFIIIERLMNGEIVKSISDLTKNLGYSLDEDFDQMTIQFARHFTTAVGDIDFNNFNFDDEQLSGFSAHSKNTTNRGKQLGFDSPIDQDKFDDENFGNIMNMIQRRQQALPNLFHESNQLSHPVYVAEQ